MFINITNTRTEQCDSISNAKICSYYFQFLPKVKKVILYVSMYSNTIPVLDIFIFFLIISLLKKKQNRQKASSVPFTTLVNLITLNTMRVLLEHKDAANILVPLVSMSILLISCKFFFYRQKSPWNKKGKLYEIPPFATKSLSDTFKALASKNLIHFLQKWSDHTGKIYQLHFQSKHTMVVVSGDLNLSRQVLNDKTSLQCLSDDHRLLHNGGENILSSDGAFWKHSRKNISPAFASHQIKQMNEVIKIKKENYVREKLNRYAASGESFDVGAEMIDLTLSVICEAAFEYTMSSEEKNAFLTEYLKTKHEIRRLRSFSIWKLVAFIPTVRRVRLGGKHLLELGYKILDSYRQLQSPKEGTVIDLIANNKDYKNDKERASDIVMILVAGHGTTAHTLAWTILELAKNPFQQEKLRKELKNLELEQSIKSIFLGKCIKESMRLRPTSLGSIREITHDMFVRRKRNDPKDIILIPKGSAVLIPQILLNHNPDIFDNPNVFDPSRWDNPSDDALKAFMPFSLGRKNCIGQSLAKAEIETVLASLFMDYQFSVDSEGTGEFTFAYHPVGTRLFVSKC